MPRRFCQVLLSAFVIAALTACHDDGLDLHSCPTIYSEFWHPFGLRLLHTQPQTCPVFLPGPSWVTAGGKIIDGGEPDMNRSFLSVKNPSGATVGSSGNFFRYDEDNNWSTELFTEYFAGSVNLQSDVAEFTMIGPASYAFAEAKMTISYTSQVNASISGPGFVEAGTTATWTANVSTGQPPFTYKWYRDWGFVGSESSYTEEVNGEGFMKLRLDVYDARGEGTSVTTQVYIGNCGTQIRC